MLRADDKRARYARPSPARLCVQQAWWRLDAHVRAGGSFALFALLKRQGAKLVAKDGSVHMDAKVSLCAPSRPQARCRACDGLCVASLYPQRVAVHAPTDVVMVWASAGGDASRACNLRVDCHDHMHGPGKVQAWP